MYCVRLERDVVIYCIYAAGKYGTSQRIINLFMWKQNYVFISYLVKRSGKVFQADEEKCEKMLCVVLYQQEN
jgi:hypothetical protein